MIVKTPPHQVWHGGTRDECVWCLAVLRQQSLCDISQSLYVRWITVVLIFILKIIDRLVSSGDKILYSILK